MTIYVTAQEPAPTQMMYSGAGPSQVTYVTAGPAPVPPQTTYVEVISTPAPTARRSRSRDPSGSAAVLLFAYGGMDMAECLGWNLNTVVAHPPQMDYSWFIGVIIGAVVAAFLVDHIPKLYFYCLGGLLELIDAIIFVSASEEYAPIMAARYVGGAGIGLITVVFIIHNSETASKRIRGLWCGWEQFALALGIAIQVILSSQMDPSSDVSLNCAHGIFGIVLSVISTGCLVLLVESPVFHLRHNNEEKARICQNQLFAYPASPEARNAALREAKEYVAAGSSQSISSQLVDSAMPLIKMLFSRCLVALTFSLPLTDAMLTSTFIWQLSLNWPIIVWGILRWIGTILAIALADIVGRKFVALLGLLCMAGLILGMAGVFSDITYMVTPYYMGRACQMSMAFQFFAGLYAACTPTYLGEAFPLRVKSFLIALIVCIEQVIHIIVIVTLASTWNTYFHYFLAVGIVLVVSLLIFGVLMPETRGLSLQQATERFTRVHDIKAH